MTATALLAGMTAGAKADTIQFLDVPTHVNDGSYYVMPYEISIDGTSQLVACYDIFDDVNFGDTWQAQLLTLNQAASSGFFPSTSGTLANYERVAWLDAQQYQTPAQQIGLQYAIWDVFGTYKSTPESLIYDAAANTAASTGYQEFDFSGVRFIEQTGGVAGQNGTKQAFVFWETAPTGGSGQASTAPEPRSALLSILGIALLAAIGMLSRRHKNLPRG